MGLLFSGDAPPPHCVHDVVGFQLAWFKKYWVSIWLSLLVWTGKMLGIIQRPGLPPSQMTSGQARAPHVSRELWCQDKG